ncbi:hypothetical protein CLAFUW4_00004 [Fulvia fulva]|uniref:Uncharacterized protein n=1 Tax=Passalora fulva TaxID=5499 RepID=A0A9Q8P370_PASFU|nr:uncharacterized protein CLAFUR5_00003 [Fulvia fulva]KAK4635409.1 hypothetical protein CLAFUR4_00004 [Fulvia fulva]KAK4638023.1 hypothetical protein CLAFUR0_00004 [Fulvia fulva]UJO11623.1 hypothetical protein CLAFUR5_00003 [Fulvia fulva]WPV09661.1 hypothetical protein CLAFUW4_00004 [Fulvia fulva]WPV23575.1 hypothetical protein CLAFUW7_00004 [Fulvia fulva]
MIIYSQVPASATSARSTTLTECLNSATRKANWKLADGVGFQTSKTARRLKSSRQRYHNEPLRINKTVNHHMLGKIGDYLTGDRTTYTELMWLSYMIVGMKLHAGFLGEGPYFHAWEQGIPERPAVRSSEVTG